MRPEGTILFISDPYLYAVSADGEVLRQLSYVHTELSARWSPNGQKILFVSQHEGNPEIYVMNADGTELINLTHSSRDELSARWFPDGGKVLFFQQSDSSEFIYVVDVDGTNQTVLAEYQEIGTYDLSPSGQWLVFGGESEDKSDLFLVSVNNAKTKQLTHNTLSDRPVKWSPDGRKILFVSEHDGNRELYVMDADGAHQTRLTYTEDADESMPSWSPEGKQILYLSEHDGNRELYVMDADGAHQTRLTYTEDADESMPSWSPDGRYIAYEEHHSSDFNPLYIVSPGSVPTKVGDEGLFNDVWSYAWSPDSQYLAISGIHAWEGYHIYIVDIACATSLDGCGREDANNILLHHPPFHNVPRGLSWSPITRK
jgi:Tol biopolymer transport system component